MACDISFYAFFPNNYDGNEDISFQDPPGPRGAIVSFFKVNFMGPMKWALFIDITMACDHFTVFFLTKTMDISKFHSGPSSSKGVNFHILIHFYGTMKGDW